MIFENNHLTINYPDDSLIPGYMIVAAKGDVYSMADLDGEGQASLVATLKITHRVLNDIIRPERIYTLSIGEVQPRLHFHVFPRTAALLAEYRQENNITAEHISGLLLFEWARAKYKNKQPENYKDINTKLADELNKFIILENAAERVYPV